MNELAKSDAGKCVKYYRPKVVIIQIVRHYVRYLNGRNIVIDLTMTFALSYYMTVTYSLLEKVAKAKGIDTVDLPPLYDALDPDSLDGLIDSLSKPTDKITFTYADYSVTVSGEGMITLVPIGESEQ